jgi:hypothetical protein
VEFLDYLQAEKQSVTAINCSLEDKAPRFSEGLMQPRCTAPSRDVRNQRPAPERPSRFFPFGYAQGFGSITAAFAQNDT